MSSQLHKNEFWQYSLKLYSKSSVKEISLNLQDNYAININILLFCCWYGFSARGVIQPIELEKIIETITPWNTGITKKLRVLRRLLGKHTETKEWAPNIYQEVLSHEITSEQIEQLLISQVLPGMVIKNRTQKQKIDDTIANFNNYFAIHSVKPDAKAYLLLQSLLAEVFPNVFSADLPQLRMPI